jgi:soluble lytic murein transglycosylase
MLKQYIHLLVVTFFLATGTVVAANNSSLQQQRKIFEQAKKALQTHQLTQYNKLYQQLNGYPLQPYLDYLYLHHRLDRVSVKKVNQFIQDNPNTFYAERLRSRWLDKLAAKKQWQTYIDVYQAPQSAARECHYVNALFQTGQQQRAYEAIPALWLVPRSQHKNCDPVFKFGKQKGLLTSELVKQRMFLALRDNQFSLAKFLAKTLPDKAAQIAWIDRWQKMHKAPDALLKQLPVANKPSQATVSLAHDTMQSREIIAHGIKRLARKSAEKAHQHWQRIQTDYHFSEQDLIDTQTYIARRAALSRKPYTLKLYQDLPNDPWRARAALWAQDWQATQDAILSLNSEEQQSTRWQYWLARSLEQLGDQTTALETYQQILNQRDYYSFLASDRLQQSYQMNHQPIAINEAELTQLLDMPSVQRLKEFYHLHMKLEARREGYSLKKQLTPYQLQLLATQTHQWGWHNQTIAVLGKARYWDAIDLRFPVLYEKELSQASKKTGIDTSWLMGIARQESAFNPIARSRVGALGLMQVMPKTGKLIAKIIKSPLRSSKDLLKPRKNIELGSAYLKHVYEMNQNNPVLATASYNAGPHRVKRWMPAHDLPADIWAENIPFNETRHYVQNVMAYAAIFDHQRKQPIKRVSDRMPVVKAIKP